MSSHPARGGRWLVLGLLVALAGCASNALHQARVAESLRDDDLAVAGYLKYLREHPNSQEAQTGLERAKLRASDSHLFNGRRLVSQGRYEDAVLELQLANELNPTNAAAETELRRVRITLRTQLNRPEAGTTALQSLLDRTRDLPPAGYTLPNVALTSEMSTGTQASARTVYQTIARLANISLAFDPQFRDVPAPVNLRTGLTVRQALDAIAAASNTFYQLIGPSTIIVVPDTPLKRRDYAEEVMRQFPIQNADVGEVQSVLRIVGDVRSVDIVKATNTIVVRDTPERMQAISQFIAQFDKASPEIVVDVELLEVNRTSLLEYGLQLASPGSLGIDGSADVNRPGMTLQMLRNLSQADVVMANIPALYYRLLKTDGHTRTLANPHLRVTDMKTVTASFGDKVPVPKVTITPIAQGGVAIQPQTSFEYQPIGVNIDITPRTSANDDIALALRVELTSLGLPGFDGLPTFGNRSVQTSVRLKDGETTILAGLIRQDERTGRQTIPGLGSVPVLGSIFSRTHKEALQTDVVILLTPHIVRVLDLSEADLRPLRLPREGTGAAMIEPAIVPSPIVPPNLPGRAGGAPGNN